MAVAGNKVTNHLMGGTVWPYISINVLNRHYKNWIIWAYKPSKCKQIGYMHRAKWHRPIQLRLTGLHVLHIGHNTPTQFPHADNITQYMMSSVASCSPFICVSGITSANEDFK